MSHVEVPEAEALLDKEIKVLDHGFVRLVDYMGGDSRIVQSARVSYGKGTKSVREDVALIDYLMRHQHTSPFEQVVLTFHCKMPIFVARQWIRHRAARVNEISGRYSVMEDEFYIPDEKAIQLQSQDNRQGRAPHEVPAKLRQKVLEILTQGQQAAYHDYQKMLADDIARELARINLPLSLYTQWYWQIDLHNLFHFLQLRLEEHAQWETRQYARVIADLARAVAPLAFKAFETHILKSVRFSGPEIQALALNLQGHEHALKGTCRSEYEAKLKKIKSESDISETA
ncbi:MAG: FAD-dependent thymidylate synthase [Candidatus Marinimicrobia bacterium]|jgi:thymidylate synthase (FAD)|nr:FAD-dependent thymidylate synthase [Candidatus Neomarinimicrobiota bacterium]MCK9482843.1 FAD-dependent thymidylate synthase [Candidatus Neomarinimicrobiota bacterium]MCK9559815.1 FAD-dependent thymidylate synthase [Candidatus Neomarinimicrobiota bacterium]MDD5062345.1 FAD-dependent thymidylate synthase [Candidatus Neomarinimicrobiota bacterium]MDD5539807.1 FAD-dependent thymidylate synthase [Candidatus Neomarinimicrobiota bacterium]